MEKAMCSLQCISWLAAQSGDVAIADLLAQGFAQDRTARYWIDGLERQGWVRQEKIAGRIVIHVLFRLTLGDAPIAVTARRESSDGTLDATYADLRKRYLDAIDTRKGVDYFRAPFKPWSPTFRPRGVPRGYIEAKPFLLGTPVRWLDRLCTVEGEIALDLAYADFPGRNYYDMTMVHFVAMQCPQCKERRTRVDFDPMGLVIRVRGQWRDASADWHCKICSKTRADSGIVDTEIWESDTAAQAIRDAIDANDLDAMRKVHDDFARQCEKRRKNDSSDLR